jgi:type VI secretion system secreted protein Hcp
MAIYMLIDGITGDVTAQGHAGWIECNSLQYGFGRGISMPVGNTLEREATAPSVSEVTVSKSMDSSSPYILQESCVGKGKTVTIHITKTGQDQLVNYLEVILTNTMISGYSVSSGGDNPSESVSLNYTKITTNYTPVNPDGTAGSAIPAGYDVGLGQKT